MYDRLDHTGDDAKPADSLDIADHDYINTRERRQNAESITTKPQEDNYQKEREVRTIQDYMGELPNQKDSTYAKANLDEPPDGKGRLRSCPGPTTLATTLETNQAGDVLKQMKAATGPETLPGHGRDVRHNSVNMEGESSGHARDARLDDIETDTQGVELGQLPHPPIVGGQQ